MVFSRLLANESVVGLDIGSSSIKIVRAEPSDDGVRISQVAMCPTPPDAVKDGVIVNIPEVAAAVQFAIRTAGIKASGAIAAIAGSGVIVRHVQVPKMTEQVLRRSIRYEASKCISAPVDDCVIEFEILEDTEDGRMKIVIVAAPNAMVESKVGTLEQAGLEPVAIDLEAFATFRALVEYHPDPSVLDKTIALLDVGASHTEIDLVCKGNLALTRAIPIAGSSVTKAIRGAENCTDAEAEELKLSLDLSEVVDAPAGPTTNPSLKIVQSHVDELLREIRRSVNYYQSQLPEGTAETTVDRVVLTGGTARLKGLVPYASRKLGVDVETGNQIIGSKIDPARSGGGLTEEDAALLAIAFGLAVKEMPRPARLSTVP